MYLQKAVTRSLVCAMVLALAVCGRLSATQTTSQSASKSSSSKTRRASTSSKKVSSKTKARDHGQKAPTPERISEIQLALTKDGSFNAIPNGKWDDSTVDAMKKFQASHGLGASGRLDAPTLQKLGMGSQTAGIAAPTPPPGSASRLTNPAQAARRQ
jgi:peptidoglycan hydrolase-like protein with peptidoglycan-binding domain